MTRERADYRTTTQRGAVQVQGRVNQGHRRLGGTVKRDTQAQHEEEEECESSTTDQQQRM